jgi:hypothetical protein
MCETEMASDYVNEGDKLRRGERMSNVKLNMLHARYIASPDRRSRNEVFTEIYAATKKERNINRSRVTASGYGDEADAQTVFDDVIFKMLGDTRITDFERTLNRRLRTKRIDLLRKVVRTRARQCSLDEMYEEESEGTPIPEEVLDKIKTVTAEQSYLDAKKETNQRQLIDFFSRSAKTDSTTTTIVAAFLKSDDNTSPNAIAKSLGLHHETVSRKLRSLSRLHDANRFGEYREYLAI